MKYLFFTFVIVLSCSCKKSNLQNVQAESLKTDAFLTIPHEMDQSILRRKLMNIELGKLKEGDVLSEIQAGDEFIFKNDDYKIDDKNKADLESLKEKKAELIVSFKDHLDIYFLPAGVSKENALKQIDIQNNYKFNAYWNNKKEESLSQGRVYYLLFANKFELFENDIYFHSMEMDLGENYTNQEFNFYNNQELVLLFDVKLLQGETAITSVAGATDSTCTDYIRSINLCTPCFYNIEKMTGKMFQKNFKLTDLNFTFLINNKLYELSDFDTTIEEGGRVKASISLSKITKDNKVKLIIYPPKANLDLKEVYGYDYSSKCVDTNIKNILNITPVIKSSLVITVKGTGMVL